MDNFEEHSLDDMIKHLKSVGSSVEYKSTIKYGAKQSRREKTRILKENEGTLLSSQASYKTITTIDLYSDKNDDKISFSQPTRSEQSQHLDDSQPRKGFQKFTSSKDKQSSQMSAIFDGLVMFYVPDQSLSKKKIEIFEIQVEKNRGEFHSIAKYWQINQKKLNISNLIISTILTPSQNIERIFSELGLNHKCFKNNLLDSTWISECLKAGKLVDKDPFKINLYCNSQPEAYFVSNFIDINQKKNDESTKIPKQKDASFNENSCEVILSVSEEEEPPEIIAASQNSLPKGFSMPNIANITSSEAEETDETQTDREMYNQEYADFVSTRSKKSKIILRDEDLELIDFLFGSEGFHYEKLKSPREIDENSGNKKAYFTISSQENRAIDIPSSQMEENFFKKKESFQEEGKNMDSGDEDRIGSPFREFKRYDPSKDFREEYWDKKKDHFLCVSGAKTNYNELITSELEKLLKIYTNEKDRGRMFAYKRAISTIRSLKTKIESIKDVENLTNIGIKIREKIKEILSTGMLKKTLILQNDEKNKTIDLFSGIWGVGSVKATQLFEKGFRTLEQLRHDQTLLNDNQKVGLKYFEEFNIRIPRTEVTEMVDLVKEHVEKLSDIKSIYDVICCGSFRRGKETCGDIDILLTRKDGKASEGFMGKLVKSLEATCFLTDHLVWRSGSRIGPHDHETYMGVCQFKGGPHRRIDLKIYPREQFGFALLYFTGSDFFNRSMRLFARKKGYSLTDQGLFPVDRVKGVKAWIGEAVPCYSEHEVFVALGLDYKSPEERNV